ncbi:MAG: hypothetical protein ACI9T7_003116 [Oleiphilaceae bacterium]|jgi:hypothetical protein
MQEEKNEKIKQEENVMLEKVASGYGGFLKLFFSFVLLLAFGLTVLAGYSWIAPFIHLDESRSTIQAISEIDVLKPVKEELDITQFYIDSILKAASPAFFSMGTVLLLAMLITSHNTLNYIRKVVGINSPEENEEDKLKRSIIAVLDILKTKFGKSFFPTVLFCVVFGGLTIGASVELIVLQKLAGMESFLITILCMVTLVILAIFFYYRFKIDLGKASGLAVFGFFFLAIVFYGYGLYQDFDTKRNIFILSKTTIELHNKNKIVTESICGLKIDMPYSELEKRVLNLSKVVCKSEDKSSYSN